MSAVLVTRTSPVLVMRALAGVDGDTVIGGVTGVVIGAVTGSLTCAKVNAAAIEIAIAKSAFMTTPNPLPLDRCSALNHSL